MYRRAHRSAYRKKKKKEQSIDYAGWKSDTGQSRGNHRRNKDERSSERKIIEIKREKGNLLSLSLARACFNLGAQSDFLSCYSSIMLLAR